MASVEMICRCGERYTTRQADIDRGWGKSCSKSCAALRRDFGGNAAKRADGKPLMRPKKKGANRIVKDKRLSIPHYALNDLMNESALYDSEQGWDAHKAS